MNEEAKLAEAISFLAVRGWTLVKPGADWIKGRYMKDADGKIYAETWPEIKGEHKAGDLCKMIVVDDESGQD